MRRGLTVAFLLAAIGVCGCRSLAGRDVNDNPRITPTSVTGVTTSKGSSVYANIPQAPAAKQP